MEKSKPTHIQVVDDDASIREVLKSYIEESIPNVLVNSDCENGKQGLDYYKEHKPDLVIMDIDMPVMNGVLALMNIIQFDTNAKVIILSGNCNPTITKTMFTIGAIEMYKKPVDFKVLMEIIKKHT